jgi:hypothetical protein
MLLESCLRLTAEILVEWVIFADVTLEICMSLAMSCVTRLRRWLVWALATIHRWWSFLPIFELIDSWYGLMGGTVKWLIVWGVTELWQIMLCSWVFRFAERQCCDGLDDLQFLLSNSTFHDFKLCCGSTWILAIQKRIKISSAPGSASTSPPCTHFLLHAVALLPGLSFTPLNQFSCSSPSSRLWFLCPQEAPFVRRTTKC